MPSSSINNTILSHREGDLRQLQWQLAEVLIVTVAIQVVEMVAPVAATGIISMNINIHKKLSHNLPAVVVDHRQLL